MNNIVTDIAASNWLNPSWIINQYCPGMWRYHGKQMCFQACGWSRIRSESSGDKSVKLTWLALLSSYSRLVGRVQISGHYFNFNNNIRIYSLLDLMQSTNAKVLLQSSTPHISPLRMSHKSHFSEWPATINETYQTIRMPSTLERKKMSSGRSSSYISLCPNPVYKLVDHCHALHSHGWTFPEVPSLEAGICHWSETKTVKYWPWKFLNLIASNKNQVDSSYNEAIHLNYLIFLCE